jgi:hypothetical protein
MYIRLTDYCYGPNLGMLMFLISKEHLHPPRKLGI